MNSMDNFEHELQRKIADIKELIAAEGIAFEYDDEGNAWLESRDTMLVIMDIVDDYIMKNPFSPELRQVLISGYVLEKLIKQGFKENITQH